jgi:hypothetical protein
MDALETLNTGLLIYSFSQACFPKPKKTKRHTKVSWLMGRTQNIRFSAGLPGLVVQWPFTAGFSQSQLRTSGGIPAQAGHPFPLKYADYQ